MAVEVLRKEQPSNVLLGEYRVRWGGIFSGSFITTALAFLFMILGSAIGLPSIIAINPMLPESFNGPSPADGLFVLTWIYSLVTLVASFFCGGYCAARISRAKDPESAALYGLSSWAVVVVFVLVIVSTMSPFVEQLLAGNLMRASSWLVVFILAFGALFSALGGTLGRVRRSLEATITEGEGRLKTAS